MHQTRRLIKRPDNFVHVLQICTSYASTGELLELMMGVGARH
jgi:hypothetical protein